MPSGRPKKQPTLDEMGDLLGTRLGSAAVNPSIHNYIPHEKQIIFHSSPKKGRLYIGGNRSGKTVGGIVEDVWRLLGTHPYQNVPQPPVRGRLVCTSYTEGVELVVIPELKKWIPPSALINGSWEQSYNSSRRLLTLANGSTMELMSYDQALNKFAGTSRHFTHFDEEPPKSVFTECKLRLLDTRGQWYITMTPVDGMTWVFDDLYNDPGINVDVIEIDTSENPHIDSDELEEVISDLSDDDRKARKEGKFVNIGGLVYKKFNREAHMLDVEKWGLPPKYGWTHYASLDHGYNNPTCWLFHAVSPKGLVITYDEIYQSETLIQDFARMIIERSGQPKRKFPDIFIGDPAIRQRNAQTGDSVQAAYARLGIPIALGNNDVNIGVEKMNKYLQTGMWRITSNCTNLINEMQRVRWKIYETAKMRQSHNVREEIHKYKDHAPDSARYFFSSMPILYLPNQVDSTIQDRNKILREALSPTTVYETNYDRQLNRMLPDEDTEWRTMDEHLGGIF